MEKSLFYPENHKILDEKHENHKNLRISYENYENQENHRISLYIV